MTRKVKMIIGLVLVLLLVDLGGILAQATKTFTGKISEIAKGTELDVNQHGTFYTLRLEGQPKISFRLSNTDAVRFGVIDPTGMLTPKKSKGLGWQVKLDCNPENIGSRDVPVYKVTSLVRLDDQ
ncbi:MAG TPA: hypothetical protein VIN67_01120 [Desulfobaccales bacterium]